MKIFVSLKLKLEGQDFIGLSGGGGLLISLKAAQILAHLGVKEEKSPKEGCDTRRFVWSDLVGSCRPTQIVFLTRLSLSLASPRILPRRN